MASSTTRVVAGKELRGKVIDMYKRLIKTGKGWVAKNPDETQVESEYIIDETRRLFKINAAIISEREIVERLREAEARLVMAEHYRIPYPRPVNLPPHSFAKKDGKRVGKRIEKINKLSKPVYVRSIDDASKEPP